MMDLTKEAIEKILSLAEAENRITEIDGTNYHDGKLEPLPQPKAKTFEVSNLSSLVEYFKANVDGLDRDGVMFHVESPSRVSLITSLDTTYRHRECPVVAIYQPPNVEGSLKQWNDAESFNIMLQAGFVSSPDREQLLKVVGTIVDDVVRTTSDDGISQAVTVKQGARPVDALVPNPVILTPYATFTEVEQVERKFVFRMRKGPECRLIEADGGAWRGEAMKRVADYIKANVEGAVVLY